MRTMHQVEQRRRQHGGGDVSMGKRVRANLGTPMPLPPVPMLAGAAR
ncbi:hypothetical protein ISN76_16330 [Dyella halodurans]|uniref:Uncharacterized protein n=1 Tax=Dyella halodurans TaxID=1920171 RepID=A0ABV9C6Z4_9GAMM|nr:hypothetical protein [Dyella halodurans]